MQQTKRRGKKGVILLALALALFVLAIMPAAAMAVTTWSINGVVQPNDLTAGTNFVTVTWSQAPPTTAAYVAFQVAGPLPAAFGLETTPRVAYADGSANVSLGSPLYTTPLQQYQVKILFYTGATGGTAIESLTSGIIYYDNTKSVSTLDLGSYGADGTDVPVAPSFPGPPDADYGNVWFGPHYTPPGPPGTWVASGGIAQGDFEVWGATPHSVVYDVDGLYHADIEVIGAAAPWVPGVTPANPIPFYGAGGILTKLGALWGDSPDAYQGFHWVHHHAVAATGAGDWGPESYSVFGWDSLVPRWTVTGLDEDIWYGNAPLPWSASVTDNPGSGVATATVQPEFANNSMLGTLPIGTTHPDWTWWQRQASGTLIPRVNPTNPMSWSDSWDANNVGTVRVSFQATDAVLNMVDLPYDLSFDLIAPHTTHTSDPALATSFVWNPNWVNTNVTVTFHAMDPGYDDGDASGVAYTEYIIGSATSTPPAFSQSGTQGDSVTITQNAPSGPVYLWFRSVDNAVPANKEVWQRIYVYIDKPDTSGALAQTGPTLENDVPSWWINDGYGVEQLDGKAKSVTPVVVPILFGFDIWFDATDPNSGIGPDLIRWRLMNWNNNAWYSDWHQVAPDDYADGFMVHINAADDGIYSLDSKVSDRAGNLTELSTPLMIDTRPPVTDGTGEGDSPHWINGTVPYVLTATDQSIGAGVAATIYRVDQSIPWLVNEATTVATQLETSIDLVPLGGTAVQGRVYTIDFGSVDAALPYDYNVKNHPYHDGSPSYMWGNLEGTSWIWGSLGVGHYGYGFVGFTGYKTEQVKLDVTAPTVTAMDPKNGNWQKGPGTVNFSGEDVGSGYAYTEWSTDGGTTWKKGEVAQIGGDGEITVTYHGVDKVGLMSADQTIVVKVASTGPSVSAMSTSVKKGKKATFGFNVTSVTPLASQVTIQIRTMRGRTLTSHHYDNVTANSDQTRSFRVRLKAGKYYIRILAVDQAGNNQTMRGKATLTVR